MEHGTARRALREGFDRSIGIAGQAPALRADLLDTAMLRPMGFVTASLGFLLMTAGAFAVLRAPWTAAWLAADLLLLGIRLVPAVGPWRAGVRVSEDVARAIVAAALAMFVLFGLGCAASFVSGVAELQVASAVAVMGLLAGVATRWAGLPRLARATILLVSAPMAVAMSATYPLAALLFAVVALGTTVQAAQNNRTLLAMMEAERTARRLAITDALTGLLNRAGLEAALAERSTEDVVLLFLDLDGFKAINDRHGHAAGDRVLAEVGVRLRAAAPGAPVARLGGDEFVLVLRGDAAAPTVAELIREGVGAPIRVGEDGPPVRVGVSCGIATGSLARQDAAVLLAAADEALYATKRSAPVCLRPGPSPRGRAA